jgi:RNA polymerase sigma-70 factor (ECF subfamily)
MLIDRTSDVAIPGRQDSLGERALVEAARAGDREAFGQLVQLHERVAVRTALAALGCRADAEDAAQEAFLLAWRKLHAFRGRASFRTWLLTIVWRQALARRRARQRWWERLRLDATPGSRGQGWDNTRALVDRLPSEGLNPEESALARSLERQTARAIARLPPKLRDTLLLAASGEHAYEEIGRLLGVAVGTVKWRVSEARRLVSRAIEERP